MLLEDFGTTNIGKIKPLYVFLGLD